MGLCENAPDKYCGHVLEPKNGEADDTYNKFMRNAVCLREPKYRGRCVWHADTDEKTAEELVESRLTPDDVPWKAEYVTEHLSGAILQAGEFPDGFSFGRCVLVQAEFSDTFLSGAEFPDADLHYAKFSNADLHYAKFSDANLHYAGFPGADLRYAEFPGADLRYAEFSDANLHWAEFSDAYLRYAKFSDADLREAEFPDANLEKAEFSDAFLPGVEFSDALLPGVEFSDAFLPGAEFSDASLPGAEFSDAFLRRAEFPDAYLKKAEFSSTDLREVNLLGANLQAVNFSDADLQGAAFRPACTIIESDGSRIDQYGASLEDAQFEDGTDLRGADLSGARLYQTAFRDVRINDETEFGIDDENPHGMACRYEYDKRTGVSTNEDVSRLRAATWTYRRLESLFEENAMNVRAQNAHIRKEEGHRAQSRQQVKNGSQSVNTRLRSLGQYIAASFNWHVHRHGESVKRLLGVSGLLIFLSGIVYAVVGVSRNNPETTYRLTVGDLTNPSAMLVDLLNGWYFSVITFSTIGYGDFYPTSPVSRLLVGIESLAGALFIALFVFVLGRRVAR